MRDIMLAVEADTSRSEDSMSVELDNGTSQRIAYHVLLLYEAGLIAGQDESVLSDLYPVW